jgi:hypothetical protein
MKKEYFSWQYLSIFFREIIGSPMVLGSTTLMGFAYGGIKIALD